MPIRALDLSFADGVFDHVNSHEVTEHVADPRRYCSSFGTC